MASSIQKNKSKLSPLHRVARTASKSCKRIAGTFGKCVRFVLCVAGVSLIANAGQVALEFDYPTNELQGMTFRAYATNNVTAPVITWPLLVTFISTNRVLVTLPEGFTACAVQASNTLGTSFFSVAAQAILPRTSVVPKFVKP